MIKVDKDLDNIPPSLNSDRTKQRRNELIAEGSFISSSVYNSRYKMADIKERLQAIYHGKCAFCERKNERWDVEHFRPKSIYYWLTYSWDNLLLACPTCNGYKKDHFKVRETRVEYQENDLGEIHTLADRYNELEQNQLVHPEKESVEALLTFTEDGSIQSEDEKANTTIFICRLDRKSLKDERKKLLDDVQNKIKSRFLEHRAGNLEAMSKIKGLIEDFAKDSKNPQYTYLAFRKYATNYLLPKIPE